MKKEGSHWWWLGSSYVHEDKGREHQRLRLCVFIAEQKPLSDGHAQVYTEYLRQGVSQTKRKSETKTSLYFYTHSSLLMWNHKHQPVNVRLIQNSAVANCVSSRSCALPLFS